MITLLQLPDPNFVDPNFVTPILTSLAHGTDQPPARWRQVLDSSVPGKSSKDDLLAFALRKWPMMEDSLFRKKDHNRAEALIMASTPA